MNKARKEKEELDKYNQAQESPESLQEYLNKLLNIQISNKEHINTITDTVTWIQDIKDTIKNDNDLNDESKKGLLSFNRWRQHQKY